MSCRVSLARLQVCALAAQRTSVAPSSLASCCAIMTVRTRKHAGAQLSFVPTLLSMT